MKILSHWRDLACLRVSILKSDLPWRINSSTWWIHLHWETCSNHKQTLILKGWCVTFFYQSTGSSYSKPHAGPTLQYHSPVRTSLTDLFTEAINMSRLEEKLMVTTLFYLEATSCIKTLSYPHYHAIPQGGPYSTRFCLESFHPRGSRLPSSSRK